MTELKICPFCGCGSLDEIFNQDVQKWYVICTDCLACGPKVNDHNDAYLRWNERR